MRSLFEELDEPLPSPPVPALARTEPREGTTSGWVVFDPSGRPRTWPADIYTAWRDAGWEGSASQEILTRDGWSAQYVEMTIKIIEPSKA